MSKIILTGHIEVPTSDLDAVLEALPTHMTLTRQEQGCLLFEVTQDPNNPCNFSVYEEFVDQQAFDTHQSRVKTSDWGKITHRVKRHYQIIDNGQS
ncbi:putative quinol monooxygenase [Vibrio fortis]|jgi:quinol monooxygenase YgiN|uniref:putative quinol monooxygenase n=1 Tax=Vibrio fortis TaxID=212667 RepID=UPI0021C269D0|nr:putative quinol monooxygenase [Vibrio fortis]